jgi:predicted DNA-binding ribbon-helix-helix protein
VLGLFMANTHCRSENNKHGIGRTDGRHLGTRKYQTMRSDDQAIDSNGDKPDDDLDDAAQARQGRTKAQRVAKATLRPVKRSFSIRGHRTSISLEGAFWEALREQAERDKVPVARIVAEIDGQKGDTNLSSAIRVWILTKYRQS